MLGRTTAIQEVLWRLRSLLFVKQSSEKVVVVEHGLVEEECRAEFTFVVFFIVGHKSPCHFQHNSYIIYVVTLSIHL